MHSWSCDHMYKIWHLTEELPSRHDVVLQAWADERPGVLHISWAGNEYLTRPFYHQLSNSFLKLLKRIILQKLLLAIQSQPDFHQGQTAALPCRVQSVPPPTLSWFYVNSNLLQPVTHPRNFLVIPPRHPCYLSSLSDLTFEGILLAPRALSGPHALGHRGARRRRRPVSLHCQEWGPWSLFFFIFCFCCLWEYLLTRIALRPHTGWFL